MNWSTTMSAEPFWAFATYFGSYFSGLTFTSHTVRMAQRSASSVLRILWPRLKSTIAYRLRRFHSVSEFDTAPVTFGVMVPMNRTGAVAHGMGAAPEPPSHRTFWVRPVAASSVALVTRFAHKPPIG